MSLSADFSSVYFGDNAICVLPESDVCLQTLDAFKKRSYATCAYPEMYIYQHCC